MLTSEIVRTLVTNPFVLRCAWRKLKDWYSRVEWAPEPEWTTWRRDPWTNMRAVAEDLASSETIYTEAHRMPQIPYPKQGGEIRHYVQPTVRTQAAHMIFAVLLAPYIEARLANVNFGSRWYRGIRFRQVNEHARWEPMPYSLADRALFNPYKRDYGLFRRLASWTVNRFLGTGDEVDTAGEEDANHVITSKDYPDAMLPYVAPGFTLAASGPEGLCYARLDLKKAYPSIHRTDVRDALLGLVAEASPVQGDFELSKWAISPSLEQPAIARTFVRAAGDPLEDPWGAMAGRPDLRCELALAWMTLLDRCIYDPGPDGLGLGTAIDVPLRADIAHSFGLPTGLAVSPLLLNVALAPLDYRVINHLETSAAAGGMTSAYLRFADDMIVLGVAPAPLSATLNVLRRGLLDLRGYHQKLRPQLNQAKARPASVQRWLEQEPSLALTDMRFEAQERVTAENRGEFVTALVHRMSGLGQDSILDRIPVRARQRLSRLHEIARWDIRDIEVRPDTRVAFAANRLAGAWLPLGVTDDDARAHEEAVTNIRRTIRRSIIEAPWKFALWRSAIRAALRRPASEAANHSARTWLVELLGLIAQRGTWNDHWPAGDGPSRPADIAKYTEQHRVAVEEEIAGWERRQAAGARAGRVSFLRAHFWRELARTVRSLDAASQPGATVSNRSWIARVVGTDPDHIRAALAFIRDTDDWANALYGAADEGALPIWEREAICLALAAFEDSELPPFQPTQGATELTGSTGQHHQTLQRLVTVWGDHVLAGHVSRAFHRTLAPGGSLASRLIGLNGRRVRLPAEEESAILAEALESLSRDWGQVYERTGATYWVLDQYRELRRALLARPEEVQRLVELTAIANRVPPRLPDGPPEEASRDEATRVVRAVPPGQARLLYKLVWGRDALTGQQRDPGLWQVDPTSVPGVGLPVPWAIRLLHDMQPAQNFQDQPGEPYIASEAWATYLASWRIEALRDSFPPASNQAVEPQHSPEEPIFAWSSAYSVAPHPIHLIPRWLSWSREDAARWSAVFHLFFAATGTEDFHESVWQRFGSHLPWSEAQRWRCRCLLPQVVWELIDRAISLPHSAPCFERLDWLDAVVSADGYMAHGRHEPITTVDFRREFPSTDSSPMAEGAYDPPPPVLEWLGGNSNPFRQRSSTEYQSSLPLHLKVRVAQVEAQPAWKKIQDGNWPIPRHLCEAVQSQILQALETLEVAGTPSSQPSPAELRQDPKWVARNARPALIMFPEGVLHPEDAEDAARYAASMGVGLLAGLTWRVLPPAVPGVEPDGPRTVRHFVNEALLSVPHLTEHGRGRQPLMFTIRKPRPAQIEYGLQEWLTASGISGHWRILPGTEWLRFEHPSWGPFGVAICSDIIELAPWAKLKGSILHLFMVAWNTDLDLYDAMTWSRAYELYVNFVGVNHGEHGGTLAWVPKHSHGRNVFSVRGDNHFVVADLVLPARELADRQGLTADDQRAALRQKAAAFLRCRALNAELRSQRDQGREPIREKYKALPVRFEKTWESSRDGVGTLSHESVGDGA